MESWRNAQALWKGERDRILLDAKKGKGEKRVAAQADLEALGPEPDAPPSADRTVTEPTFEGLTKLFATGQPSLGLFSDEGGQFLGGHAMNSDNRQKTLAALNDLWQGNPIRRTRLGDAKSFFTKVADKIADLFKPQPAYNLNLGNKPPAQLTREAFVPLSEFAPLSEATGPVIGAAREGTPNSVSALTELQTQIDAMTRSADGQSDAAARAQVFGTMFRGNTAGTTANNAFVTSHLDFRSIAEDIISSSADQIIGAAKKYEAFLDAAGLHMGADIYHALTPQATPEADAMAEAARHELVVAVFETADRVLDAMFATDGWVAGLSDDLKAFTSAKMDVIASSDARSEEKAGMARKLLAYDFLLRGVNAEIFTSKAGMDEPAGKIVLEVSKIVQSLLNNVTVDKGSAIYEPAQELFQTLRDKHQDEPMDTFFEALGMPAEYRKDA